MSLTRRQELIAQLENGPATLRELAERLGLRVRDVVDDLEHIRRSLSDRKLLVDPAVCLKCNYAFEDRLRRHYRLFREAIESEESGHTIQPSATNARTKPNAPSPSTQTCRSVASGGSNIGESQVWAICRRNWPRPWRRSLLSRPWRSIPACAS